MNVNRSFFDVQKFILPEVLVRGDFVSGSHVLDSHNKVLRTVVLGAYFQKKASGRRLSPNAPLALIFLKEERFCGGLGSVCRGLCRSSVKDTNRNQDHDRNRKGCTN